MTATEGVIESLSHSDATRLWLNLASNAVLTAVMAAFLVFLFGRENSFVYKMPAYKTFALKAGLALCTVGAALNVLLLSTPQWSEVVLNLGLATLFSWATWFHYDKFVKPWKQETAPSAPKPITAKRRVKGSGTGASSKRPATKA